MPRYFSRMISLLIVVNTSLHVSAASFQSLDIPSPYSSHAVALSPDGSVVMGEMWAPRLPSETFRWSVHGGLTRQADLAGWGGYAWPYAMSYDGSTVVGYDAHPAVGSGHAFMWSSGSGRIYLDAPAEVEESEALAVSWDGMTIVGYRRISGEIRPQAVVWQNGRAMPLGSPPAEEGAYATGIALTGVIVGRTPYSPGPSRPVRWASQSVMEFIELPDSISFGMTLLVSADGHVIVGDWSRDSDGAEAFIMTPGQGAVGLGDLQGGRFSSTPAGVSADGRVIVGSSATGISSPDGVLMMDSTTAFIWDSEHGMRSLPEVLTNEYGLDLHGWELWQATAISADGRTIVGDGASPDGYYRTWIAHIPEPSMTLLAWCALALMFRRRWASTFAGG